jgi:hypothetical protein
MDWRESSAVDGKRGRQLPATLPGNWIPAIPAGMTGEQLHETLFISHSIYSL